MAQVHATINKNKYKTTIHTEGLTFFADEPVELGGTNLGPNQRNCWQEH